MPGHSWGRDVFPPIVAGGMVACIGFAAAQFVQFFAPDWNAVTLTLMPVLAALLGYQSYRIAHRRHLSGTELWQFQGIELLALFVIVKVAGLLDTPLPALFAEMRGWGEKPGSFFDGETLVAFSLTVAGWLAAWSTATDMEEMADPMPYEGRDYSRPLTRLQSKFFGGGICLLLVAGLTRTQYVEILKVSRPTLPALAFNVLLYFVGGLFLLGQLRFARQARVWQMQQTPYAPALNARWMQYTLILLGVAMGMAFLLPTGYTLGFLELISLAIGALIYLISILYLLLMLPISYLLALFTNAAPAAESPPAPAPFTTGPFAPDPITPVAWPEILRSALFWGIALAALGYVLRSYWKDRPEVWEVMRRFRPLAWGLDILRHVSAWWRQRRRALSAQVAGAVARWRAWRPHLGLTTTARQPGLSQREQVFYHYLNTLDQAQATGLPRRKDQTPYEYHQALTPQLPEAQEALSELTEAFVEARYSEHPVNARDLAGVRAAAQQVQTALQTLEDERDRIRS